MCYRKKGSLHNSGPAQVQTTLSTQGARAVPVSRHCPPFLNLHHREISCITPKSPRSQHELLKTDFPYFRVLSFKLRYLAPENLKDARSFTFFIWNYFKRLWNWSKSSLAKKKILTERLRQLTLLKMYKEKQKAIFIQWVLTIHFAHVKNKKQQIVQVKDDCYHTSFWMQCINTRLGFCLYIILWICFIWSNSCNAQAPPQTFYLAELINITQIFRGKCRHCTLPNNSSGV